MDLDALEALCARGEIGTAVLTGGTTGFGAVDPIDEALALRERYGVRIHVDAAYGGFFRLLDDAPAGLRAIESADSVVIDPHKHGLQPYGCGAVMFKDPRVGRFYAHDSPFTYFTSDELHLGEISLECSRAGAAAAALWLTLRAVAAEAVRGGRPPRRARLRRAPARIRHACGCTSIPSSTSSPTCRRPAACRSSTPPAPRSCTRAWTTPRTRSS